MSRKRDRICLVCGKDFKGIASANTCSPACRIELARLKEAKKRPDYLYVAKGKGQKIPDLSAPKRLKFKKGEKKPRPEFDGSKIIFTPPTEKSFDCERVNGLILDESGQYEFVKAEAPKELTAEQKLTKRMELEEKLKVEQRKVHGVGDGHPRMWRLQQDEKINTIKEQINLLQ